MSHTCVIFDIASNSIKAGFAGDETPKVEIDLDINVLSNIPDTYSIFNSILVDLLQFRTKNVTYSILILEPLLYSRKIRETIYLTCIRHFQIASICMVPSIAMPLIASGADTGIVVDIGYDETTIAAFVHGKFLVGTVKSLPIGMIHAQDKFFETFVGIGDSDSSSGKHCVDKGKYSRRESNRLFHKYVGISCDGDLNPPSHYESVISTDTSAACLECIINGSRECEQDEVGGISGLLISCMDSQGLTNITRALVVKNILFSGVGSSIPGIREAICSSVTSKLHDRMSVRSEGLLNKRMASPQEIEPRLVLSPSTLPVPAAYSPMLLTWIGGSVFACIKANEAKFIKLSEINYKSLPPTRSATASRTIGLKSSVSASNTAKPEEDLSKYLNLPPDWMSLDEGASSTKRFFQAFYTL